MSPSPVLTPLSSSPRAPGLDLLRALAIVVVMLYHLSSHGIDVAGPGRHGWMGVDLFFVLSGYLIGWPVLRDLAAGRMPDWAGFVVGRAWRILPAYLAVLALYLALPAWREADAMPPVWQFLTFTMNVLPEHLTHGAYSHAWSLCVEEHFYLLFPLLAWLLSRRGRLPGVLATSAGAALLFGAGMLLRDWEWRHAIAPHLASGGDAARAVAGYVGRIYSPTWTRLDGCPAHSPAERQRLSPPCSISAAARARIAAMRCCSSADAPARDASARLSAWRASCSSALKGPRPPGPSSPSASALRINSILRAASCSRASSMSTCSRFASRWARPSSDSAYRLRVPSSWIVTQPRSSMAASAGYIMPGLGT